MIRRHQGIFAAVLLLPGLLAGAPATAGNLNYSDVNPGELRGLLMRGQPEDAVREANRMIDGLRPTTDPPTLYRIGEILTFRCEAHNDLGQYMQAQTACLEAIAVFADLGKNNHNKDWRQKRAESRLADAYEGTRKYDAALALRQTQLDEVNCGQVCSPEKIQLLIQIGDLQVALARFRDAEASYLQAVADSAKVRHSDRAGLPSPRVNLAIMYRLEEHFDKAEHLLKEGMAEIERNHALLADIPSARPSILADALKLPVLSQSLAWTYLEQGRLNDARELALDALEHFEQGNDANNWLTTHTRVLLGRIEDAESPGSPSAERYLASAVEVPPEDDFALSYVLHAVAQSEFARHYLLIGNDAAAEPLAREAVETLAWILGEDNYQTARAKVVLARTLRSRGRQAEARDIAQAAYATQWASLPTYHSEIGENLALLAELYATLGEDENAAAIEELTAAFRAERARFEAGQ